MKHPLELTGKQRRSLRALAHHLSPIVHIGQKGLTDELVGSVRQALLDHELIKIKLLEGAPVDRREVGPMLAERLEAHDIAVIGRVVTLYRRHPTDPVVALPRA
jgi:RNA-binding protein